MKLIIGLGNPGLKYVFTRHNVGFWVVDELSKRWKISIEKRKWKAQIGEGWIENEKVILVKPLTYMNLSGESIHLAIDELKLDIDDVCVIYDDLDIPVGKIRLRLGGSSGGHNGMKSMIQHLGTEEFKRIKMGIGRPPEHRSISSYVLSCFLKEEKEIVMNSVIQCIDALQKWIQSDFVHAMNEYNRTK